MSVHQVVFLAKGIQAQKSIKFGERARRENTGIFLRVSRKIYSPKVVSCWYRLPGEVVEPLSLEVLENCGDMAPGGTDWGWFWRP